MRYLPSDVPLIVKTTAPEEFVRREAQRPLTYVPQRFDTGTWQASNVEIDWERTFDDARRLRDEGPHRLKEETAFLRENNVGVVVADAPALPLEAAALSGVPGIAIVNFTWVEIYQGAVGAERSNVRDLIDNYRRQYSMASLTLRTPLSFPMNWFPRIRDIPLIARKGTGRRIELEEALGAASGERIVLLYFGAWGSSEMELDRLKETRGMVFVSMTPMPEPVQYLDPDQWHFPDVVASADAVVAKPGYGTIGECMANGTPVVYYPRPEFAEYPMLRNGMQEWGGAVEISRNEFLGCHWSNALDQAMNLRPLSVEADGARIAAQIILQHASDDQNGK